MPITAKDTFDYAIQRSEHFLTLYDLLHDTRIRRARSDWLAKIKDLMHWPQSENVVRIDGKDRNSMLIIRESLGIDESSFSHEYSLELLRSATSSSISALDRYMHDLISEKSWALLNQAEDKIPKELAKLRIPALATKKAVEKLRRNSSSRPGTIIRKEIQNVLHTEFTFQNVSSMENGAKMLGIKDFWGEVSKSVQPKGSKKDLQDRLRKLAKRRNQIVHEADLILQTKNKSIKLREITRSDAEQSVEFIKCFVAAIDEIANR